MGTQTDFCGYSSYCGNPCEPQARGGTRQFSQGLVLSPQRVFSFDPPPPERSEDTLLLAKHILRRRHQALGKPRVIFSPESEQMLVSYHWPGNIRELENVVERAVNLVNGAVIEPEFFGLLIPTEKRSLVTENGGSLLEKIEKQTIMDVIAEVEFNVSKAAHILGITRATLYKKFKKYNIPIDRVTRQC